VYGAPTIDGIDVLMVCTGNICRSPMAEVLLREHLVARGVDARVRSAGTLAWRGPATDEAVEVMDAHGLDLRAHRAQELTATLVAESDLIVGMTRNHVWGVTAHEPGADARAFVIGELVRLGPRVGPRAHGESARDWAAKVAAGRGDGPIGRAGDDVADPYGEPLTFYEATAARLDRDLRVVAKLLAL
jgi:protein-tyrosine phosphatase